MYESTLNFRIWVPFEPVLSRGKCYGKIECGLTQCWRSAWLRVSLQRLKEYLFSLFLQELKEVSIMSLVDSSVTTYDKECKFSKIFIYLFLAALGLCCCTWNFSSCNKQGLLSNSHAWVSYCSGSSCCAVWALKHTNFSSCGSGAQ